MRIILFVICDYTGMRHDDEDVLRNIKRIIKRRIYRNSYLISLMILRSVFLISSMRVQAPLASSAHSGKAPHPQQVGGPESFLRINVKKRGLPDQRSSQLP